MIETVPKTWFLTRPRRFGKPLAVSTFGLIFSGQRELFKRPGHRKEANLKPPMPLSTPA
ncbi:MAG: AAA family ATPase [Deltaproteobacteria bacterium]|nr:AAA family ATPase [Deltaproteobacteria bacterium]